MVTVCYYVAIRIIIFEIDYEMINTGGNEMGVLRSIYFKLTSEEKLRKKADKMYEKLERVDFYENNSNKYRRLASKYHDYVNAVGGKCAKKLPKREHGWYIHKDD